MEGDGVASSFSKNEEDPDAEAMDVDQLPENGPQEPVDEEFPQVVPAKVMHVGKVYNMSLPERGLCLIINNLVYKEGTPCRYGSTRDERWLRRIFEVLGFKVIVQRNLTAAGMKSVIENFTSRPEHQGKNAATLVILSHGTKDHVTGVDGTSKLSTQTIATLLNNENCPKLQRKPKMVFVLAHRTDLPPDETAHSDFAECFKAEKVIGDVEADIIIENDSPTEMGPPTGTTKLPTFSDILICCASQSSYADEECDNRLGHYTRHLVQVLALKSGESSLRKILQKVEAAYKPKSHSCFLTTRKWRCWEMMLYFNTGLYEGADCQKVTVGDETDLGLDNKLEPPQVIKAQSIITRDDVYSMTRFPRGLCLIINNVNYYKEEDVRRGSKMDEIRFQYIFTQLGFEVQIDRDLKAKPMLTRITSFASECQDRQFKGGIDAVFLIILAHGGERCVFGVEMVPEKVFVDDILKIFNSVNCPHLENVPKIIVTQACQGGKEDIGVLACDDIGDDNPVKPTVRRIPDAPNFTLCFSSQSGYKTSRSPIHGGLYSQVLANALTELSCKMNLRQIMQSVATAVRKLLKCSLLSPCCEEIGWEKSMYFNPGLYINSDGNVEEYEVDTASLPNWNEAVEEVRAQHLEREISKMSQEHSTKEILEFLLKTSSPIVPSCVENAAELLLKAKSLNIARSVDFYTDYLNNHLNVNSSALILKTATEAEQEELAGKSQRFLLRNFTQVYLTRGFLCLPPALLSSLTASDQLCLDSEYQVFDAVKRWTNRNGRSHLASLITNVRLSLCDPSSLQEMLQDPLIKQESRMADTARSYLQLHASAGKELKELVSRNRRHPREMVYVIGGWNSEEKTQNLVEKYDYLNDCWLETDIKVDHNSSELLVSVSCKDEIFVINEVTGVFRSVDPNSGVWKERARLPMPRRFLMAVSLNGMIYVIGGTTKSKTGDRHFVRRCDVYDPSTDIWRRTGDLNTGRCFASATVLRGKLYCAGGWGRVYLKSAEVFDPRTQTWTLICSLPLLTTGLCLSACDNYVWAFGGFKDEKNRSLDVLRYDPETDLWEAMSTLPNSRYCTSVAFCGGDFYVIGGRSPYQLSSGMTEIFNPKTNSWRTMKLLNGPRFLHSSCVFNSISQ